MAVEPEKDAANAAEETSKAEAAKNWEERRASRPPVVPSASAEPFGKSPSTKPPPLDLELSQPAQPVAAAVPPEEAPRSIDPESSIETVRTVHQESAPTNEAAGIATGTVGDPAAPRLAAREPEPKTEPADIPPATEPLPPKAAAAAAFAQLEANILGTSENKKDDVSNVPPPETAPMMDPVVIPPAAAPPDRPKTDPMLDHVVPATTKISSPPARNEQVARAVDVPAPAPRKSTPPIAPPAVGGPLAAFETLARSARLADLVALTESVVREAAKTRSTYWTFTSKVARAAEEARLGRSDADTPFGNALDVLGRGAENASENALACALWAHAVCEATSGGKKGNDAEEALAGDILWLATHTSFDATPLLDRALGEDAAEIWAAIAARVRKIAKGRGDTLGRGEAIVGCAALASSGSPRAKALSTELATGPDRVDDPVLVRLLATGESATPDEVRLEGEMVPTPRGFVMTALLAVSGILFVVHAARFIARIALAYKRPTEVSLSDAGVRVKTRTEMLGRTLREREHVIVRSGLVRVVREVRYPRLAFYAGLLALVIGSYIGVRAFADGVRAASPSLLVVGLLIVAIGIGADFLLGTVLPGVRGRVRLAFVPRTGTVLCIGNIDARRADDALARTLKTR